MKPQGVSHRAGRRKFFKNTALLGGTAVLMVFGRHAKAKPSPAPSAKSRGRGYRLTTHIRKYYEKASL
jgi:hypothetical protein